MSSRTPHILFISTLDVPFIRDDLAFFQSRYRVTPLIGHGIGQVARIVAGVRTADVVFCWFASTYAAVGVITGSMLRKRTLLQVGGADLAKEEEIGYGLWTDPWKSALVRRALRSADRVLAVDATLVEEARLRGNYPGRNLEVLPTGFDANRWTPGGPKEDRILVVAGVPDLPKARIKGLDTLLATARADARLRITVVGVDPNVARALDPPSNVELLPWLPQEQLLAHYRRAKVYCQPSRREGLSNALCEAMLCGCVPVATAVGGSPRAVGAAGWLVFPNDPPALLRALHEAMADTGERGLLGREHIIQAFPKRRREERLAALVEGIPL